MDIRLAETQDIPALQELWKEFMDFHAAREPFLTRAQDGHETWAGFVREHIDDDDRLAIVAEDAGQLVGYGLAALQEYPPVLVMSRYGMIRDVAVTAGHRRRGVGRALFAEMERWFLVRGVKRVELHVSVANEGARRFWRAMGFRDYVEKLARDYGADRRRD
jgi:ribosomal protein S18 acetylase RimI-like enzyme